MVGTRLVPDVVERPLDEGSAAARGVLPRRARAPARRGADGKAVGP